MENIIHPTAEIIQNQPVNVVCKEKGNALPLDPLDQLAVDFTQRFNEIVKNEYGGDFSRVHFSGDYRPEAEYRIWWHIKC
jgi:hypothetical protein